LTEVRLDHNRICAIETLTFSSNPRLRKISLSGNQISEIAKNSFDSLEQLEWLDLADNALTTIGTLRA
jgi:Leucine-rich repeat (LRR) protein